MNASLDEVLAAHGWRTALRRSGLALVAGLCAAGPGAAVAAAQVTATTTYSAPGVYEFIVPAGVTSIQVTAVGAAGGLDAYPLLDAMTNLPVCHLDTPNHGGRGASVSGTLPVSPGEVLAAGVGSAGANGCVGSAGGTGGGGNGGQDGTFGGGFGGGGGGGGASEIGLPEISPGFHSSPLLVAAGGGGAGETGVGNGGDAGQNGFDAPPSGTGGGAGTLTAGGAGGASACSPPGVLGGPGSFGVGGIAPSPGGGGGGGGGYFGGGAGGDANGGGCPGYAGGGGGGSSFIASSATNTSGPTVTSATPEVLITYPVPTAAEDTTSLGFATQPQGTVGPEHQLTLTNNGSAPLLVSGVTVGGAHPGDYLIADRCQAPVAPGTSCVIGVRFAPQSEGASSAALTLSTNAATAAPSVSLSGVGGPLPQGPRGPKGDTGATGQKGPAGPAATVVCRNTKTGKLVCTLEFASGTFTVRPAVRSGSFQVQRGRRTVIRGRMTVRSGKLTQVGLGRLVRGTYMLTVKTVQSGHNIVLLREPFVVR